MTGGQVAALGCAVLLLLPGGCFLLVGLSESDANGLFLGVFVLLAAALLFWVAFARRPGAGGTPPAPPGPDA